MLNKLFLVIQEFFTREKDLYIVELSEENKFLKEETSELDKTISFLQNVLKGLTTRITELYKKISVLKKENYYLNDNTELDDYCKKHFQEIGSIAYKQKRKIQNNYYSVSLNELVTPKSYMVKKFFKDIKLTNNTRNNAKLIGNRTGRRIKWTSDKNLDTSGDYYLYPAETIVDKKGDCEDFTFVNMSGYKEIGGAWGYYKTNGHAFNIFVYKGSIWILDSTGGGASIHKWKGNTEDDYKIHYIITRNHTYKVLGGVQFGVLAGW